MTRSPARDTDVLVVGGGPAGLAAAVAAEEAGARVLLVDRDRRLGGILNQCVHDGFGLELFGESLTGPEYAARLADAVKLHSIRVRSDSIVLSIDAERTCDVLSPSGYQQVRPHAVVLAMGCRERSFGSLAVPGTRPAGIFSAGAAQRLTNIDGLVVGRHAVILGSGDIGLIMARRMTLEGARVASVVERLPFAGGLPRNVSQCLNDFGIPLLLGHTVVEVLGSKRLEAVVIAEVGPDGRPLPKTRRTVACDTLLVSVGLLPENELTRGAGALIDPATGGPVVSQRLMTTIPGVFACGNVLHVHDLADWASLEGRNAGLMAARYASAPWDTPRTVPVCAAEGIRYVVPQRAVPGEPALLHFRVTEPCGATRVIVRFDDAEVTSCRFPYLAPSTLARVDIPAIDQGVTTVELRLG